MVTASFTAKESKSSHDKFPSAKAYRNVLPARIHLAARRHPRHCLPGVPPLRCGLLLRLLHHASHRPIGCAAGRGATGAGRDPAGERLGLLGFGRSGFWADLDSARIWSKGLSGPRVEQAFRPAYCSPRLLGFSPRGTSAAEGAHERRLQCSAKALLHPQDRPRAPICFDSSRGLRYLFNHEFSFPSPPSPSCAQRVGGGVLR